MTTRAPAPVQIPAGILEQALGRAPFQFRHAVGPDHPLLEREAVIARASTWPPEWLEHHEADLPFVHPGGQTRQLPITPGEVVRSIDENGCWVVLWNLERSTAYSQLNDECLDPIAALARDLEGGISRRGLNVVIASPETIVPVHFDLNHNFLLQTEGTKVVMVGSYADSSTADGEIARYFDQDNNNCRLLPDVVSTFHLGPGDGVYIPPYGFHWVRNGPEVSVALSCGFRTPATEQAELVHRWNARLRKLGFRPQPPGLSRRRDRMKVTAQAWERRARVALRPVTGRVRRALHVSR